ncbi:hypothetical protein B7990_08870 [Fibrobacter sp. UWB4]|nr:hypothetical protein B7990_08870 [Fibrobacter sp. UWB4]
MIANLFAGDEIFLTDEFTIILAFGTNHNSVSCDALLVPFVNSPDSFFERLVPLLDVSLSLLRREWLRFEPCPDRCFGRLYGGERFAGGPSDGGVLPRYVDNWFCRFFFVGIVCAHVNSDSGEDDGQ